MSEIAAELGLSRNTVSAVINGASSKRYVSAETERRVREHLAQRGFVPSRAARHLRSSPKRVIGLLHLGSLYSHLVEAFHLLSESLTGMAPGLEIMVTPREQLESALHELLSRRVTDLVWLNNPSSGECYREDQVLNYLGNTRTIVYNHFFNAWPGDEDLLKRGIALVGVDRTAQHRRMARFLRDLGHKVIALPSVDLSAQAYVDAFTSRGLVVAECPSPFEPAKLVHAMKEQGVTAACFKGDREACQAISALRELGVRIPEDLTVTGFDGMSLTYSQDLTTLVMPVQEMVAKVCELVADPKQELRHCFDMELAKGKTHGPPARRGKVMKL